MGWSVGRWRLLYQDTLFIAIVIFYEILLLYCYIVVSSRVRRIQNKAVLPTSTTEVTLRIFLLIALLKI